MGMLDFIFKGIGLTSEEATQKEKQMKKNVRNAPAPSRAKQTPKWNELDAQSSMFTGKPIPINKTNTQSKNVAILEPRTFPELRAAVEFLQTGQPALVNLNSLEDDIKQRGIDFFGGAVFALRGKLELVSVGMYMFAPAGMSIFEPAKEKGIKINN